MNEEQRQMDLALAECEAENRLLRARNERLMKEVDLLTEVLRGKQGDTKRPVESDYLSFTAYTRALEAYCGEQEQRNVTKNEHDVLMKALAKSVKVVDAGFLAKQEQG